MVDAGIQDVLVITSRRKRVLEDWFDRDPELEAAVADAPAKYAKVHPTGARVTFVRQRRMGGTGHALLMARNFAGQDAVVVAYPDDLFGSPNLSADLIAAWRATGSSVLAAVDMTGQDVSRYGVIDAVPGSSQWLQVRKLVEKPPPGEEPSHLVSMGRYLYTPEVFPRLQQTMEAHQGGEFFPQEAVSELALEGKVVACVARARRYDTGTPLEYLKTTVEFAMAREDIGPEFTRWLRDHLATTD
jgi:UTP--glucose-1-phosphate uridylyltransferase